MLKITPDYFEFAEKMSLALMAEEDERLTRLKVWRLACNKRKWAAHGMARNRSRMPQDER